MSVRTFSSYAVEEWFSLTYYGNLCRDWGGQTADGTLPIRGLQLKVFQAFTTLSVNWNQYFRMSCLFPAVAPLDRWVNIVRKAKSSWYLQKLFFLFQRRKLLHTRPCCAASLLQWPHCQNEESPNVLSSRKAICTDIMLKHPPFHSYLFQSTPCDMVSVRGYTFSCVQFRKRAKTWLLLWKENPKTGKQSVLTHFLPFKSQ